MKRFLLIAILSVTAGFGLSLSAQEVKVKAQADSERPAIELTVTANRVNIENAQPGQKLEVFSIVGLKMEEIIIKSSPAEYTLNVPRGYYILRIGDTVRKIVIK